VAARRNPIFSAKKVGQRIGYIEGNLAFDLLGRRRAAYDCETGLLRDPVAEVTLGYITLKGIFVGSSSLAEELFPKAEDGVLGKDKADIADRSADATSETDATAKLIEQNCSESSRARGCVATPAAVRARINPSAPSDPATPQQASPQKPNVANDTPAFTSQKDEAPPPLYLDHGDVDRTTFPSEQQSNDDDGSSVADGSPAQNHLEHNSVSAGGADALPKQSDRGIPVAVEAFMQHLADYLSSNHAPLNVQSSKRNETPPEVLYGPDDHNDADQKHNVDKACIMSPDLAAGSRNEWPIEVEDFAVGNINQESSLSPPDQTTARTPPDPNLGDHIVAESAGSDQYPTDRVREAHESLERAEAHGHLIGSINEMPSPPLVGHEGAGQQTDLEVDSHVDGENAQSERELDRPPSAPNERADCSIEGDADGRHKPEAGAMSDSAKELDSTDIELALRLVLRKLEDPW
jgi:hypothetical protein